MQYREIDLSEIALYGCSEDVAKSVIDWRIDKKKTGISNLVFKSALKMAVKCVQTGEYESVDDALIAWETSGWTGMKYILKQAREDAQKNSAGRSTRNISLDEQLSDRSWAAPDFSGSDYKQLN